ncbi:hypothetical protein NONI108955_06295 [Nocardia ninae]|uniref:Secreted protein n=1 Tax=Nocardia ninae NBRC 108245 TaxID=1210091 RepID=A0A511MJV9_9NOCA|nr:hypothetical protein [Nocardia ninae]GEM40920.1 hypothetical protein NN4_54390 [Nocardia ninae NBRC 108245]
MLTSRGMRCVIAAAALAVSSSAVCHADEGSDGNTYECEKVIARDVGKERRQHIDPTERGTFYYTEVVIVNAVGSTCKPLGSAPSTGPAGLALITTKDGELVKGEKKYKGRMDLLCWSVDAGDGSGIVTGERCAAY